MCVLSYPYLCWAPNSQWFPVVRDKLINPIPQGFILDINPFNKDSYYSRWDECIPNIRSWAWSTLAHNMKRCCWYYNLYIYIRIYMHIFALECGYVFFIVYINSYPLVRPRRPPYDTLTPLGPRLEDVFLNWLMSRRALVSFRDVSDGWFPPGHPW